MKIVNLLSDELLDIIIDFHEKGFYHHFTLENNLMHCLQNSETCNADEILILEIRGCGNDFSSRFTHFLIGLKLFKYNIKGIMMIKHRVNATGGLLNDTWGIDLESYFERLQGLALLGRSKSQENSSNS